MSGLARAADPPGSPEPPPPSAADASTLELLRRAGTAFREGRREEALQALREAWRLNPTAPIAANMARVELVLGHHRDAAEHYRYALDHEPPGTTDAQRNAMRADLDEAKAHVGTLQITLSPPDAQLSLAGRALPFADLPSEIYVDPGLIQLTANAPSHQPAEWTAQVAPGSTHAIDLELTPIPPAPPPAPPLPISAASVSPSPHRTGPNPTILLIGTSLTAATLGAHLYFRHQYWEADEHRLNIRSDLPNHDSPCLPGTPYPEQCAALADAVARQDRYAMWSNTSLVVTGAFALATLGYLTWTLVEPGSSSRVAVTTGLGAVEISGTW